MTGAETAVGIAVGKAVFDVTVKAVPWMNFVQRYQSYNLLIIGPERSGKTTLSHFLRLNRLGYRGERTKPTVGHEDSGCFIFEWKTENGTNLSAGFRNVSDQSGQKEPHELAKLIAYKRPHLIIVVLDITARQQSERIHASYANWLDNLCAHLADILMSKPRARNRLNQKLRQILILLNKVDRLNPGNRKSIIDGVEGNVRRILRERLRTVIPEHKLDYFPILPCCMVRDPENYSKEDTIANLQRVMENVVRSIL
jgi:GTPase SAR1 family protein